MMKRSYYYYTTTPNNFLERARHLGFEPKILSYQPGDPVVAEIEIICTEEEIKKMEW